MPLIKQSKTHTNVYWKKQMMDRGLVKKEKKGLDCWERLTKKGKVEGEREG